MSKRRKDILQKELEIRQWISEHRSKGFICRQLNCKPETLEYYLAQMNIVYLGNKGNKGYREHSNLYKNTFEYLQSGNVIKSHYLKNKILRDGLKPHKCEMCGNTEWNNLPIPLELHHKNGDHYDNSWDNLQLLCPNCHAQQSNNSGAAKRMRP